MGFLAAGSLSLAQPWHPRMTYADFNGDGVVDQIETLTIWDSTISAEEVAHVDVVSADGTVILLLNPPATGGLFGNGAIAIEDADDDGVADLIVSAPMEPTAGGRGRVYLISGATGAVITSVAGPQDTLFGAGLRVTRDLDGDGKSDVAVASLVVDTMSNVRVVWRAYSGSWLSPLGSGLTSGCQGACRIGSLADANADDGVTEDDAVEVFLAEGTEGFEAVLTDVNGDGVTDGLDTQAAVAALFQPSPPSCPVPLPAAPETLIRMLGMWDGRVCEGDVFVEERPQMWNASTSSCLDSEYAEEGTPCSGQGCLWNGKMSWRYWSVLLSGLGSIDGVGWALDSTGCLYSLEGDGSLDFGAGAVVGYVAADIPFRDLPVRCQWPFDVGSQTRAGFVGVPIPLRRLSATIGFPMAEMGSWHRTSGNPVGVGGIAVGFGGGIQGTVTAVTLRSGPVPPNLIAPHSVPCIP
ncbi:MAG: FG-GAP repeat protein [Phycisphaeraceae bacterium]|nr:MAG: FG-GAP repeat protein [Phycisphaeraceae bacterium]